MPDTRRNSADESRIRDVIHEEISNAMTREISSAMSEFKQELKKLECFFQKELSDLKSDIKDTVKGFDCGRG